ncbi:PREDICTED: uncharacterized protein LOC107341070 [Acropora digitifera]|uniref:uncharacterized protein LOC107341070 n=1 Tax=Acropora digitifera TaxID=70779 RepID=UPI00077AD549|nr:PREDICTED: uncharacterized protein LOC107341070 [Acropora digitifera]
MRMLTFNLVALAGRKYPCLARCKWGISPIKNANNKSKTPCFERLVQTSNAFKVGAVSYETKKRTTLHQAYSFKSPVKISGVKRLPSTSFSDSLEEYKIDKMAKITPTMTEFDYNPDVASSIYSVQQALDGDVYKTIDVTAKVVNKENNKQPIVSKGKQLMKTEYVIADHTNTMALTFWEDLIDAVDCGKTCKFKNVKIRSFNDIKDLTTNEGTTIHQDQEIHDIIMDCEDISLTLNISEGKCISANVSLKRELFCIACNACIKGMASDGMITCQNSQMTTLDENCSHKLVAQLMILTENERFKVTNALMMLCGAS